MGEVEKKVDTTTQPKDYFKEIGNIIKSKKFPDDAYDDIMDQVLKLGDADKKDLYDIINSSETSIIELKDNLPIDISKIRKIISKYKEEKAGLKEEKAGLKEEKAGLKEGDNKIDEKENHEGIENYTNAIKLKNEILSKSGIEKNQDFIDSCNKFKEELKSNPELSKDQEKLNNLSQILALRQHKDIILKTNPELQNTYESLEALSLKIPELREIPIIKISPEDLEIKLLKTPGILKSEIEFTKASLTSSGDLKISPNGNVISSGDQVIKLSSDKPPEKYIVKDGYEINTTQNFPTKYPYEAKKEKLKSEYNNLISNLPNDEQTQINENKRNIQKLAEKTFGDLNRTKTNLKLLTEKEEKIKRSLEEFPSDDETQLNADIKILQDTIKELEKRLDFYKQIFENIKKEEEIEKEEKQRIPNFSETQKEIDEKARDTLKFIDNIGLININQDKFILACKNSGIGKPKIDFSKTDFGLGFPEYDKIGPKKLLIQIFNQAVSGSKEGPVDMMQALTGKLHNGNNSDFEKYKNLSQEALNMNLSKFNQVTQKIEQK
ncbi:MAG: hypothetical protein PHE25_02475 [Candidatus Gracilibacteria bacterium]|nr:hypothetical protein [Candidatus Gracilibacteria bacterium]